MAAEANEAAKAYVAKREKCNPAEVSSRPKDPKQQQQWWNRYALNTNIYSTPAGSVSCAVTQIYIIGGLLPSTGTGSYLKPRTRCALGWL